MASHNLFFKSKSATILEPETSPSGSNLDHQTQSKKPQNEGRRTRSEVLKLRLTPEEKQLISDNATKANMSVTEYIMTVVSGSPIVVVDKIPELHLELLRQGNNLNQLVKIAHQTNGWDVFGIEEAVKKCSETHKKLLEFCEYWNVKLRKSQSKKGE